MAVGQIISRIREKNSTGSYETFYLGPEQRYSGALPTSNNNNLEEQLLMGVDRITKSWHDNATNTDQKIVEFRRQSDTKNYYILESITAKENEIYVRDDVIYFGNGTHMRVDDETMVETIYESGTYYDGSNESLVVHPASEQEDDTLYFMKNDGTKLKVSSKKVTKEIDENNVVTVKEVITNYL